MELHKLGHFDFPGDGGVSGEAHDDSTVVPGSVAGLSAQFGVQFRMSLGSFISPRFFRGRTLRVIATAVRSSTLCTLKSVPFGKYWRSRRYRVPELDQLTAPIISGRAGFQADEAGREPGKEREDCSATIWMRVRVASRRNAPELIARCLTPMFPTVALAQGRFVAPARAWMTPRCQTPAPVRFHCARPSGDAEPSAAADRGSSPDSGIVDPCRKGQRHNRTHARGRHEPARGRAGASECVEAPLDRLELLGEHRAGFEERLGDRMQRIVLSHQIPHPPSKVLVVVGPTFRPKPRSTPRRLISRSWRWPAGACAWSEAHAPPGRAVTCSARGGTNRAASAGRCRERRCDRS